MNPGTLAVSVLLAGVVALIIRSMIRAKKSGKSASCCGDCSKCRGCR